MREKSIHSGLLLLLVLSLAFACRAGDRAEDSAVFARNRGIGRGMNFGNALEAPKEGDWGLILQEAYIQEVAAAGFDSVRLPICWTAHIDGTPPYRIDGTFLRRIDDILGWCQKRDLVVIITLHHFDDLYDNPEDEACRNKLISIWRQLSVHYKAYNHERLFFEPLNEPHGNLTSSKWNTLLARVLEGVRAMDLDRTLMVDAANYAHPSALEDLVIPEVETNVIVSVRYYLPYEFTHQGAHWVAGSDQWLGRTWSGTPEEMKVLEADVSHIRSWSRRRNRPVTIGEFGSIALADKRSRLTWTKCVRQRFEANGFSWSYFDFGVVFKAYDIEAQDWLPGFKEALIPD